MLSRLSERWKEFQPENDIFKQVTLGAVGYAHWQVTRADQIDSFRRPRSALRFKCSAACECADLFGWFGNKFIDEVWAILIALLRRVRREYHSIG